jgi:hypothetical protein
MSRTQQIAADIEWKRMADHESYYPLRDGPRLYKAVWCVETQRRFLPPDQIALATNLHAIHFEVSGGAGRGGMEELGIVIPSNPATLDFKLRCGAEMIRTLASFEAAALKRGGVAARHCFHAITQGDSQAELARRVQVKDTSIRTLRRLVQSTMEVLSEFEAENAIDLQRWNKAA